MINMQIQRIYTINTLIIINFFNCDASNVVTSMFLYEFLSTFSTYSTNVNCKKAPIPPMLIVKISKITQFPLCKNYIYRYFHFQRELFKLVSLFQQFPYIVQLMVQLIFFCANNFDSLNIHQHHTLYHIHTHNY